MKTLFDKIWDAHVVSQVPEGPTQLYIDHLYAHEVTSAQAFQGLRDRNLSVFRPQQVTCIPDHNVPSLHQELPIAEEASRIPVETLDKNAKEFGVEYFPIGHKKNGIIHVVGPENGITQPGMTIVCGDSHTSTHGAMGCVAFGIGTSEVEMVLARQIRHYHSGRSVQFRGLRLRSRRSTLQPRRPYLVYERKRHPLPGRGKGGRQRHSVQFFPSLRAGIRRCRPSGRGPQAAHPAGGRGRYGLFG